MYLANMINIIFRLTAFILFIIRILYWHITEKKADKEKAKTLKKIPFKNVISEYFNWGIQFLIFFQLAGLQIFPVAQVYALPIMIVGVIVMAVGLIISLASRYTLSTNWTNGYEYQIKKHHELITSGIYSYIRHPIYLGYVLLFIGGEMIAGSWLFISFFALFIAGYAQGKREEKILLAHFGEKYRKYMNHTKMLIPFVL